jgi:hypothetical protein
VRLGKIEKHLINTNRQLELLINQKRQNPIKVSTKTTNNTESFTLLKNMMTNLTEQVAISQSFMKEIKEVIGNLKHTKVEEKVEEVEEVEKVEEEEDEEEVELNSSSSDDDTNSKLLELERNIAIVSIIGIGMEPTANRIDEYIERNRRDRKRILNHLEASSVNKKVLNKIVNSVAETIEEDKETTEDGGILPHVVSHSIVDDAVLENDIIKLTNFKSHIEEEVQEVMDKIPVIIKPRKKRRGRPKKKDIIA